MTLPMCLSFQMGEEVSVFQLKCVSVYLLVCFFFYSNDRFICVIFMVPFRFFSISWSNIFRSLANVNDVNLKLEDIVFFTFPRYLHFILHARVCASCVFIYTHIWRFLVSVELYFLYLFRFVRRRRRRNRCVVVVVIVDKRKKTRKKNHTPNWDK